MSSTEAARKFDLLSEVQVRSNINMYGHVLLPGENVLKEFKAFRDVAVLTDKKIIAVNVQGLTGTKVEVCVLPYSKMTAFAVESAGGFDLDAEMKVWSSGIGLVEFEFVRGEVDVRELAKILSQRVGVSESKSPIIQNSVPMEAASAVASAPVPVAPVRETPPEVENTTTEMNKSSCPVCGAMVEEGNQFCSKCGASVNGKRICKACGEAAEEGQNFCRKCGTAIE